MLLDPLVHHSCDFKIILLQEHKVAVAVDTDVRELDPVGLGPALLQVVDDALVNGDVDGSFAGQRQVRHLGDVRQLSCWNDLLDAGVQGWGVLADADGVQIAW